MAHDLYPIVFQSYGQTISNYAIERDVLFVHRTRLDRILFRDRLNRPPDRRCLIGRSATGASRRRPAGATVRGKCHNRSMRFFNTKGRCARTTTTPSGPWTGWTSMNFWPYFGPSATSCCTRRARPARPPPLIALRDLLNSVKWATSAA